MKEEAGKTSEKLRLTREARKLKEVLADAQVDLALARSYLEIACAETDQSVEAIGEECLPIIHHSYFILHNS